MSYRLTMTTKVILAAPIIVALGAILTHVFPDQIRTVSQKLLTTGVTDVAQASKKAPVPAGSASSTVPSPEDPVPASDRYTKLKSALSRKKWRAADVATYEYLLEVAGLRSLSHGYTMMKEAKTFNCQAIKQVDDLWTKASGGRFGFSAQAVVLDLNKNDWKKAYVQLGWASDYKGHPAVTFRYDVPSRRYVYDKAPDFAHLKDGELPTVERNYNLEYSFDGTLARCGIR